MRNLVVMRETSYYWLVVVPSSFLGYLGTLLRLTILTQAF